MKNKIICVAGMLIFCLFVLLVPLNIIEKAMDNEKNKVKSISDEGSKQQMKFTVGEENHYTKLLLLSGVLEADKEVVTQDQMSSATRNRALTVAQTELSFLFIYGYYGVEISENTEDNYTISMEAYHYFEQVFEKYTCNVWKVVFENETEKHTIILDSEDYTIYYLEMDLNENADVKAYMDHREKKSVQEEITSFINPLELENAMITFDASGASTMMTVEPTEREVVEVRKNKYLINEADGTSYCARLNKQDYYLKFELIPQL